MKSRKMRRVRHVTRMGKMRNAYNILVRKHGGKRPLGRSRRRWKDIRMDLTEVGWKGVDWIHLTQDRDKCLVGPLWIR
jgi:hypothetical protein